MKKRGIVLLVLLLVLPAVYSQECEVDIDCAPLFECNNGVEYKTAICLESTCEPLLHFDPCHSNQKNVYGEIIKSSSITLGVPDSGAQSASLQKYNNAGTLESVSVTKDSNKIYQASSLTPGKYLFTASGYEKKFTVNLTPINISLIEPNFAYTGAEKFNLTVKTERNSECRFSIISASSAFDSMTVFSNTNSVIHKEIDFENINTVYIKCKDALNSQISLLQIGINKDTSAPSISPTVEPSLVTDKPFSATLIVNSDDKVVCRFGSQTFFDDLETAIGDPLTPSDYSKELEYNFDSNFLEDQTNYAYNISCMNLAGIKSFPIQFAFKVNSSIQGSITSFEPATNYVSTNDKVIFKVNTNKQSQCFYKNATETKKQSGDFNIWKTSHTSNEVTIPTGEHTYTIECNFLTTDGKSLVSQSVQTKITIDKTAPTTPKVNISHTGEPGSTYVNDELEVKWESQDPESDVDFYMYALFESGIATPIKDWTKTSSDDVTISGLTLVDGKKYYVKVNASNDVGLNSQIGTSNTITYKLSLNPDTCSNGIKDGAETSIDCGGSECSACAVGDTCIASRDCITAFCSSAKKCAAPSCEDNVKNQDETDIDCGGVQCAACKAGDICSANRDCSTGECINGICAPPNTCGNGIRDSDETDIDCGGICADIKNQLCSIGKECFYDSDCRTGRCGTNSKCVNADDSDGDTISDSIDNCPNKANLDQNDKDDDGIGDDCDLDNDNDGMNDEWEIRNNLDPNFDDSNLDSDEDGIINVEEYNLGTNPFSQDSDGDGASDKKEIDNGTDPLDPDDKPGSIASSFVIGVLIIILGAGGFLGFRYYKMKKDIETADIKFPSIEQPKVPQPKPVQQPAPNQQMHQLQARENYQAAERAKHEEYKKAFRSFDNKKTQMKRRQIIDQFDNRNVFKRADDVLMGKETDTDVFERLKDHIRKRS